MTRGNAYGGPSPGGGGFAGVVEFAVGRRTHEVLGVVDDRFAEADVEMPYPTRELRGSIESRTPRDDGLDRPGDGHEESPTD